MPSLRSVLLASTLVDFFKRLIVFLAILLSSFFSIGPSGALPSYMQLGSHFPSRKRSALSPLKSVHFYRHMFKTRRSEDSKR